MICFNYYNIMDKKLHLLLLALLVLGQNFAWAETDFVNDLESEESLEDLHFMSNFEVLEQFFTSRSIIFEEPEKSFQLAYDLLKARIDLLTKFKQPIPLRLDKQYLAVNSIQSLASETQDCSLFWIENVTEMQDELIRLNDNVKNVARIFRFYLMKSLESCYNSNDLLERITFIDSIPMDELQTFLPPKRLFDKTELGSPDESVVPWAKLLHLMAYGDKGKCVYVTGGSNLNANQLKEKTIEDAYRRLIDSNRDQCNQKLDSTQERLQRIELLAEEIDEFLAHVSGASLDARPENLSGSELWFMKRRYKRFICDQLNRIDWNGDQATKIFHAIVELELKTQQSAETERKQREKGTGLANVPMAKLLTDYNAIREDFVYKFEDTSNMHILNEFFVNRNIDFGNPIENFYWAKQLIESKEVEFTKYSCRLAHERGAISLLDYIIILNDSKKKHCPEQQLNEVYKAIQDPRIASDEIVLGILKAFGSILFEKCDSFLLDKIQLAIHPIPTLPIELAPIDELKKRLPDVTTNLGEKQQLLDENNAQEILDYLILYDQNFIWPPPSQTKQNEDKKSKKSKWFCGLSDTEKNGKLEPPKEDPEIARLAQVLGRLNNQCYKFDARHIRLPEIDLYSALVKLYRPQEFNNSLNVPMSFGTDLEWINELKLRKLICKNITNLSHVNPTVKKKPTTAA